MLNANGKSARETAIDLLQAVQDAVEADQTQTALKTLEQLQQHIQAWSRSERTQQAKAWLDDALAGELLAFNTEAARTHLTAWHEALDPEAEVPAEFTTYEGRVKEQTQRKQENIQVRGVMAHCDELFTKAVELEAGDAPPNPQFMLANYYDKAVAIAKAAHAEIPSSPELDVLARRAVQLQANKKTASRIYAMALEDEEYTEALAALDGLPINLKVPRYANITNEGVNELRFRDMVAMETARAEIRAQAQTWAEGEAAARVRAAQGFLDEHQPENAVDQLDMPPQFNTLLSGETRTHLDGLRRQADTALQNKRTAADLLNRANLQAPEDDIAAWDTYQQARQLDPNAAQLAETRKVIIRAMQTQLEKMVAQAEEAFQNRQMDRVRELFQQGRAVYVGKDDSLADYLEQLAEANGMTERYAEYMESATALHEQVRGLIWEDAVAANDLLTQLESYPDLIVEVFDDLHELRQQVNQRLNADQLYADLTPFVYQQTIASVRDGVQQTRAAIEDHPQDSRFPALQDALNMHLYFLNAQQKLEAGQGAEAVEALRAVASVSGHPDQAKAQQLLESINQVDSPDEPT